MRLLIRSSVTNRATTESLGSKEGAEAAVAAGEGGAQMESDTSALAIELTVELVPLCLEV
eukprot:COSAG01_NODE_1011_length_12147_cov_12.737384_5_plen_60_part_00